MGFTRVEINKKNILHNLRSFRKLIGEDRVLMPVVKSNAYGHGMVQVARLIDESGLADKICTVNDTEALELMKNGVKSPVFILSYWEKNKKLINNKIEYPVYDLGQAKFLSGLGKKIKTHLKVDTGTSRLGVLSKDFVDFAKKVAPLPFLEIEGVFTHYANSEEDNQFTREQTEKLANVSQELNKLGIKVKTFHAACSAASISSPDTLFDGVRLGLGLYGLWPTKKIKVESLELKPALTWKTKIIQIKELDKGNYVGYGCTHQTNAKTKMAVLPVGYNEGYDRLLSNKGEVYIKGERCKVIGRVCMNLTMIDVSPLSDVKVGDEVELMGNNITPEEFASWAETINYEVITRINPLIPRTEVQG